MLIWMAVCRLPFLLPERVSYLLDKTLFTPDLPLWFRGIFLPIKFQNISGRSLPV